ncbi:MAG: response regulator [Vicinamibacterales bacterium]
MAASQPVGNVLIVEDDVATREMLVTLLALEGFHAVAVEDGLEALHVLRTIRHRAPDVPCFILLDLAMPRMGGPEFRRAQLSDPAVATVPMAIISGAADEAQVLSQPLGAVATLAKPLDVSKVIEVVRGHCRRPATATD